MQHTNNLLLLHLFVVLKQLLSNMGWKWFNNIRRYCKNSCLILYLFLHDCNKSTNQHWHSAWWSLGLIYLMTKPIQNRKNCFRYTKLMSHLNATICTTISYTLRVEWYYLKNNYLILRSKVKVPWRSLRYATHHLIVMHPHAKYNWPIWKDKNVMVQTSFAEKKQKKKRKKKIRLKQYVSLHSKGRHNKTAMI